MAIIYSYPINTNILATDIIVGSSTAIVNGRPKNQTKSFEIQDLATYFASVIAPPGTYVPYIGATGPVNLGAYNLTVNGLTVGKTNGNIYNSTVLGTSAGLNNTSGDHNTFIGFVAGGYNTSGTDNTALGSQALYLNTTGGSNTAIGKDALYANTTGTQNTAIGRSALNSNTTGFSNTVVGRGAGIYNTTGSANSFLGYLAGLFATSASYNTFIGQAAGYLTTTGGFNTGIGSNSLQQNTTGTYNAALGLSSNRGNTIGIGNATLGAYSAFSNTTGNYNSHLGYGTGYYITSGNNNVFLGYYAGRLISTSPPTTTASNSVFLGSNTSPLADSETNQIVIGDSAIGAGSNTVTLGNTLITTTRLRGTVQGGSFVKDSGTATQYLMADGSVTTLGPLFKAASNTAAIGVTSVISSAILGSLFTDGSILKIQTMVSFPNQTLNITPITYYINTTPSIVGATQIATFDITVGQRYSWMDRSFWSIGGTFNSRNFGNSSQTSVSNSGSALGSTSIPATFYIIALVNAGVGDSAIMSSVLIEKQ